MIKQLILLIFSLIIIAGCNQAKQSEEAIVISREDTVEITDEFNRINYSINPDSIEINHLAMFSKIEEEVVFTLQIINRGHNIIPTITTARWHSNLYILMNGERAMQMTLANMSFGDDQSLTKDSSDYWDFSVNVEEHPANQIDYGKKFTFQWIYYDIESEIIEVDVPNRKIRKTKQHISYEEKN